MRRQTIAAAVLVIGQALAPTATLAGDPVEATFSFTGGEQSFDVPAGVTSVHVLLVGARGGVGAATSLGGRSAVVEGDLSVTPGVPLYVEVGGPGGDASPVVASIGGFNGGGDGGFGGAGTWAGAGGGASDVRTIPRSDVAATLGSRLMVAGGGGGGGASFSGGDAGVAGGGGTAGGGAGTQSAGGAGGIGTSANGGAGALGIGGNAGAGQLGSSLAAGGGGGGYYGGGGGGAGLLGGGGGGGSSYTGAATGTSLSVDAVGTPSVTISYVPAGGGGGSGSGTVDAVVTMATSAVCLELSTTSIDFGARQFGDVQQAANPAVDVSNCSAVGETVLAHGTDAAGLGPTSWTLSDTGSCVNVDLPADTFRMTLRDPSNSDVALSTADKTVGTLSAGGTSSQTALIDTPCPGSSGAGVTMSMQIIFVATE